MSSLVEMRERMTARLADLDALVGKPNRSEDDERAIDALLAEVNDLGPKIDREREIEAVAKTRASYVDAGRADRASALQPTADAVAVASSPIGKFVGSDAYRAALSNPRGISDPVKVGSFRNQPTFVHDGSAINAAELRAVIHSGTAPSSMLQPQVLPNVYRGNNQPQNVRDVLVNASTNSDTIVVMQESAFTNNAAETAEATSVSTGDKPESALTFTEASFPVRWIAHWMPITRQMLEDIPAMQSYVDERLRYGLARRENSELLNGNGTAPNIRGILQTSGIQSLDGTYFTGAPVEAAGTNAENPNRILRAKVKIATTGAATATFVIANPADVEKWISYADTDGRYLFGNPFGGNPTTVWGMPVVQTEDITAGTVLVGDGLMAGVFDRHDARVYTTDSHSDYFIRNLFVILAEQRIALAVFRPAAFASVALA